MRPTLYPLARELIRNKKQQKLDNQEQEDVQEADDSIPTRRKRKFFIVQLYLIFNFAV
jgi:hypothetical protein